MLAMRRRIGAFAILSRRWRISGRIFRPASCVFPATSDIFLAGAWGAAIVAYRRKGHPEKGTPTFGERDTYLYRPEKGTPTFGETAEKGTPTLAEKGTPTFGERDTYLCSYLCYVCLGRKGHLPGRKGHLPLQCLPVQCWRGVERVARKPCGEKGTPTFAMPACSLLARCRPCRTESLYLWPAAAKIVARSNQGELHARPRL